MANHKSALKRARQSEIRRMRNKSYRTRVNNVTKQVRLADGESSGETITHGCGLRIWSVSAEVSVTI